MYINLEQKDTEDTISTPIVQQTSYWSKVKEHLGINSYAFDFSVRDSDIYEGVGGLTRTNSDLLIFREWVNRDEYIAYLPYGPEIEPSEGNHGNFLEELSETLRPYLQDGCITIRYDLGWESHWCKPEDYDEEGRWLGLPSRESQEFKLNCTTTNWNLHKSNTNCLPVNTIVVDLTGTEEEILMRMKPKTRYNIRLALRKGVEVRSLGPEGLDTWYQLYTETAGRNGLTLNDRNYFETVMTSRLEHDDPAVTLKLLTAFYEGTPVAAMFLVLSAHRATYLYGASTIRNRNTMATYALQWKAMQLAKAHGCLEYDMFGIAPQADPSHPMYGLYRFKRGFGGQIYHQLGCWDYPCDQERYKQLCAYEMSMQGYYK